ncbi:spore germination protein [Fontibacillus sp. BL9]|uniref:spore germination protein n=1 Tax=Fontibacillus sp. BL9 TaxID=3389971 RepID=UPI003979B1D0
MDHNRISVDIAAENQTITEETLKQFFQGSADVMLHRFNAGGSGEEEQPVVLVFSEGMIDSKQLNQLVLPRLAAICRDHPRITDIEIGENSHLPLSLMQVDSLRDIAYEVYSGDLIIFFEKLQSCYSLDIANPPARSPGEPLTESSIKGPRDGFTEELTTNMALLRKRLRTHSLHIEQFIKGQRGETRLALLYIEDIINSDIKEEIRKRLNGINTDAIIGTSFIEAIISGKKGHAMFPLTDYTGRPDYVADCLLSGKFAVMVDGSPMAIIAPVTLMNQLISPEDANTAYFIVSLQKVLRIIGLLISFFLPGFYIALTTFNLEQIPLPLLATISNSRQGLPFPIPLETFIMLFLFEIFNEAGRRLPKALGQTVTVVGGLIIGDAAIRAGITSPTIIVSVAITIVAASTLVNQTLSGTASQLRLLVLVLSSLLGMFGFMIGVFGVLLYISSLETYGVPYLSPISPFYKQDFLVSVMKKPADSEVLRPRFLRTKDNKGRGNHS